jgi:hypothetical protein
MFLNGSKHDIFNVILFRLMSLAIKYQGNFVIENLHQIVRKLNQKKKIQFNTSQVNRNSLKPYSYLPNMLLNNLSMSSHIININI